MLHTRINFTIDWGNVSNSFTMNILYLKPILMCLMCTCLLDYHTINIKVLYVNVAFPVNILASFKGRYDYQSSVMYTILKGVHMYLWFLSLTSLICVLTNYKHTLTKQGNITLNVFTLHYSWSSLVESLHMLHVTFIRVWHYKSTDIIRDLDKEWSLIFNIDDVSDFSIIVSAGAEDHQATNNKVN